MDEEFVNSRYFFSGHRNGDKKLYGLYSPVCNCFLLLSSELEVLESLVYLMFNRMRLMVIRIDASPNYTPSLIDNWCSTNWTMSDFSDVRACMIPAPYNIFYEDLGELIENPTSTETLPDQKLIELMFFAHYVVMWYKTEPSILYSKVYNLVDLPFSDKFPKLKEIEKNCYRLIYTCSDYRDIEGQVLDTLVKDNFQ
jgi:hypothetical protein